MLQRPLLRNILLLLSALLSIYFLFFSEPRLEENLVQKSWQHQVENLAFSAASLEILEEESSNREGQFLSGLAAAGTAVVSFSLVLLFLIFTAQRVLDLSAFFGRYFGLSPPFSS